MIRLAIDDPRWLDFVSAHESATAFHHPAWASLLADCYRYPAFALALEDDAGRVVSGVPVLDVSSRLTGKRWVSLPFTDACPPLLTRAGSEDELVRGLEGERARHAISQLEVRAELPGVAARTSSEAVVHMLALDADPEQMKPRFKPTIRQNVAQAVRAGVTVRRADTADDVVSTYYDLQVRTRRRQGVPVQPRRYFSRLWQLILEPELGFCLLAHRGDVPVAGAVFLAWNGTVIYKYAASDERHLKLRPNHLLVWEAIRWACMNGYTAFDFARTDRENEGLRHFKDSWGAQEAPLVYSVFGAAARVVGSRGRAASMLDPLIRHSPAPVCRALGELLYRYAG